MNLRTDKPTQKHSNTRVQTKKLLETRVNNIDFMQASSSLQLYTVVLLLLCRAIVLSRSSSGLSLCESIIASQIRRIPSSICLRDFSKPIQ